LNLHGVLREVAAGGGKWLEGSSHADFVGSDRLVERNRF